MDPNILQRIVHSGLRQVQEQESLVPIVQVEFPVPVPVPFPCGMNWPLLFVDQWCDLHHRKYRFHPTAISQTQTFSVNNCYHCVML